jgi:wyosine [tRNA(Phe)-imidazoG37] synthetase (radical SAM superfamily)
MIAFGPIPSRRLGMSLGINNIGSQKLCSYSCVYCQLGITSKKSMCRKSCFNSENLLEDIVGHINKLSIKHLPDYLTFVANGEPTLDIDLGKEIRQLKKLGIPVAVITNSTLLDKEEVRNSLMEADWVSVKIDTVDDTIWQKINRPYIWLDFNKILDGLSIFANEYKGKLHSETMLVEGYNDSKESIENTASFIAELNPKTAYLSIPTRPPAVKEINAVSEKKLMEAWHIYNNQGITTELLTGFEGTHAGYTGNAWDDILNITAVHPLREDTVRKILQKDNADKQVIKSLLNQGLIKSAIYKGKTYYLRSYHTEL